MTESGRNLQEKLRIARRERAMEELEAMQGGQVAVVRECGRDCRCRWPG